MSIEKQADLPSGQGDLFHSYSPPKLLEPVLGQGLGQAISYLFSGRNVPQLYPAFSNFLTDKVVLNVNVLGSSVELIVLRQGNCSLVVTVDDGTAQAGVQVRADLFEETLQPDGLLGSIGLSNIFCFTRGQRDCRLALGGPANSGTTQGEDVSRG